MTAAKAPTGGDHITDRATLLASLPEDDADRAAAEEHAHACNACRGALDEGRHLVALLHQALPLPAPSPEALARASLAIEQEAAVEREAWRKASVTMARLSAGAVALSWIFQLTVGSGFDLDMRCLAESLGVLAVAIAGVTLLRGRERIAVAAMVAASAIFAVTSGSASGLDASLGIRCSFRELWAAALTWVIVTTYARRQGAPLGRWPVAAVAAAGALAAHAGQHIACEVPHSDLHLLVFHFGAVVLAALLGAVAGGGRAPSLATADGRLSRA